VIESRAPWRDPALRSAFNASITLGLAIGVFGLSFGVGAVSAGASVAQACAMSLFVFTGASQLSAVSVIGAGGSTASALGGALVLAARNGVYALTMGRRVRGRFGTRLVAAQLTIDESTAMSLAQDDPVAQRAAFWITGLTVYVFWNLSTLVGALLGSSIDPVTLRSRRGLPGRVCRDAVATAAVGPAAGDGRARRCRCCVWRSSRSRRWACPSCAAALGILVGVPARSSAEVVGA
jgi:hypothetical protein